MMPHWKRLSLVTLLLLLGATALAADKKQSPARKKPKSKRPVAFTAPPEDNPDFKGQGEYGGLFSGPNGVEEVGFQVVALGDGAFDVFEYRGGLPGAGWDGKTKKQFSAALQDDLLAFSTDQFIVVIDGSRGVINNFNDVEIGWVVKVRRVSRTLGLAPPPGAKVLFDGTSADQFQGGKMNERGFLKAGALMKEPVGDFRLHLEFCTPFMPNSRGQGRGNSGVYIQQRYEVQVLDSFGLEGEANQCGGLYKQRPPRLNMCLPPLNWQTYDIYFRQARWDDEGNKAEPARITALLNGVKIHDEYEIVAKTGAGKPESPEERPILLQDHRDPVQYRNVWLTSYTDPSPPSAPAWTPPVHRSPRPVFQGAPRAIYPPRVWRRCW